MLETGKKHPVWLLWSNIHIGLENCAKNSHQWEFIGVTEWIRALGRFSPLLFTANSALRLLFIRTQKPIITKNRAVNWHIFLSWKQLFQIRINVNSAFVNCNFKFLWLKFAALYMRRGFGKSWTFLNWNFKASPTDCVLVHMHEQNTHTHN